jgi:predicted enzyme related to lactoylglutathione lyase
MSDNGRATSVDGTTTSGTIVWFELPADDTGRAQDFYGRLFGWRLEPFPGRPEYYMAGEAGGAIMPADGEKGPVVYFGVMDLDSVIALVRELGGTAGSRRDVAGLGSYAHCTDTEGNRFGLWQNA